MRKEVSDNMKLTRNSECKKGKEMSTLEIFVNVSMRKRQRLVIIKYRKWWRAMTAHILRRDDTKKKNKRTTGGRTEQGKREIVK